MRRHTKITKTGFTLVETVIAMGIITIMITAFLAAFGPAVQGIRKAISAKEANRLASSLEYELSVLRPDEASTYPTAFAKSYEWVKDSMAEEGGTETKADFVLIYQYRGDPNSVRSDGTLNPYTGTDGLPGQDYVIQSAVRRLGDSKVQEELQPGVVEGRVFYVRMRQLVFHDGALTLAGSGPVSDKVPGGPGEIIDPTEEDVNGSMVRDTVTGHEDYPEAVIAFQAEFYVLKSSIYAYVNGTFEFEDDNGDGHPDATGKPVFTRNLAVRR